MTSPALALQIGTFTVPAELVLANRGAWRDGIVAAIQGGQQLIVLDASQTTYIDSTGLGALLQVFLAARAAGGVLIVGGLDADLKVLLELMSSAAGATCPCMDTLDEATAIATRIQAGAGRAAPVAPVEAETTAQPT